MSTGDHPKSASLERLRLTDLNWCLYAAAGLKTLSTTAVAVELLPWGPNVGKISFYLGNLLFLYVLTFVKRLGFVARGSGLALYVYTLGVAELWNYGIASMGTLYFLTAVSLAVLLFGLRPGAAWLGVTLVTWVACALLYDLGAVPLGAPQQQASMPAWNWLSPGIAYLYAATATLILAALFLRRLQEEIRRGEETVAVLAEEVAERSRAEQSARENEAALRVSQEELRGLATALDQAREQERAEVARWIHDELGQMLTAIALDASWLRDAETREEQPEERWAALEAMIKDAHRSVGRLATELRPSILDDLGLPAAIEAHVEEFAQRTDIAVRVGALDVLDAVRGDAATAVFRIVQESLTNVSRHSEAASVCIGAYLEDGRIKVTVEDDGRGIREEQATLGSGLGILGMKERAAAYGGCVAVTGRPGRGTSVTLRLPAPEVIPGPESLLPA
jgi:signal transduction histidine kinase